MKIIFFSSESWDFILYNCVTWGTYGGLAEVKFWFEDKLKKWNFHILKNLQMKIQLRQVPHRSPKLQNCKVWSLSFHWKKKIKFISLLVIFLHYFEIGYLKWVHNDDSREQARKHMSQIHRKFSRGFWSQIVCRNFDSNLSSTHVAFWSIGKNVFLLR